MIIFKDINYSIDHKVILADINLKINDAEFVAIIGPNGAGKSTLIKIMLGLLTGFTGSIEIDWMDHRKWLKNNTIGYLPQKEIYDRHFPATALDIVLMGLAGEVPPGKRFSKLDYEKAEQALTLTGTIKHRKDLIGTLSGGEFQRVLLARALVVNSNYLVLDEPEASIDRPGVENFFEILQTVHQQGKTIITISHDLHTLNKYCTFLICLNQRLHCHSATELVNAEVIHKTFGDAVRLIEKDY